MKKLTKNDTRKFLEALMIMTEIFRDMWSVLDTRLKELDGMMEEYNLRKDIEECEKKVKRICFIAGDWCEFCGENVTVAHYHSIQYCKGKRY